ncbi:SMP-30/gluconolactonase/LRE family protein [soil metagenome]
MKQPLYISHLALAAAAATLGALTAASAESYPTIGSVERLDPRLAELVPEGAAIEVLASGFDWVEGPAWVPGDADADGFLLFSEIPSNTVLKWQEGTDGVETFLHPSGYTGVVDYGAEPGSNGLLIDPDGLLISCEHGDRRLSILTKDGGKRTLVDHFEGKRLNSPNDVARRSNGDLYFTDPIYGLPERENDPRRELDFCGVYRLPAGSGTAILLTKELDRPNGIAFSPDEGTLYVAQSDPNNAIIMAFPVKDDGSLGDGTLSFDGTEMVKAGARGLPDGLKVDPAGNLFATGPGGVLVFAPDGAHLGTLATGQATSNVAFGGPGGRHLYITADRYLCRVKLAQ